MQGLVEEWRCYIVEVVSVVTVMMVLMEVNCSGAVGGMVVGWWWWGVVISPYRKALKYVGI